MTGEEHYREAERLLVGTEKRGPWSDGSGASTQPPTPDEIALAQVHATLAQAAATWRTSEFNDTNQYGGWTG